MLSHQVVELQLANLDCLELGIRRASLTCDFVLKLFKKILINIFYIFLFKNG